jgi:hypothetical protein
VTGSSEKRCKIACAATQSVGTWLARVTWQRRRVVPHSDDEIAAVAREIEAYLAANREAADGVAGIVTWWVERQRHFESRSLVEAALQYLVEQGRVERQHTPGGTIIYKSKISDGTSQ